MAEDASYMPAGEVDVTAQKKKRKKLYVLGLFFFGVVFLTTFATIKFFPQYFRLPGYYPLSIDGEKISWDEFNAQVNFAQSVQGIKNQGQAERTAFDSLVEDRMLRKEARSQNITADTKAVEARLSGRTDLLYRRLVETAILKEQIENRVVAKRGGKIIMVPFGFDRPGLAGIDQKELARTKIVQAKALFDRGYSFEQTAKELEADPQVKLLSDGTVLVPFVAWERGRTLFSKEVTDAIFAAQQRTLSDLILVSNDPNKYGRKPEHKEFAWALLTVEDISDGGEPTYADWLTKMKKKSMVISGIRL